MTGYAPPTPSYLPRASVQAIAEAVAGDVGYGPDKRIDEILPPIGGRISYRSFGDLPELAASGSLRVHGDGDFEIVVSTRTGEARDRFTIAHELGHYVLHYLWVRQHGKADYDRMEATRFGSDRAEWEANWFAAAFLMPEAAFRAAVAEHPGDLAAAARRFGVSKLAAEVRARTLGLLT